MRHRRRGGGSGLEFGGSGEDSFVAVVVTKLTGRLAVHPAPDHGDHGPLAQGGRHGTARGQDRQAGAERRRARWRSPRPRRFPRPSPDGRTPWPWPPREAAGRSAGRWTGRLPEGLSFDPDVGHPPGHAEEGNSRAARRWPSGSATGPRSPPGPRRLLVYQSDQPLVDARLVEARAPADPLAGLARPGGRASWSSGWSTWWA